MAAYIVFKLPADYNFEDIQSFEFKATSKSGDKLIGQDCAPIVSNEQTSLLVKKVDCEDRNSIVCQAPCIELNVLTKESKSKRIDQPGEVTRRASLTTNNLPSILNINNTNIFDQQKQLHYEVIKEVQTLAVPQQEREYHSLPETIDTITPVEISRPHSDTDVTSTPVQEDDIKRPVKFSSSLHIKGGEKIVMEEPRFEGLSVSAGIINEEQYCMDSSVTHGQNTTAQFYIPDESPTTPLVDNTFSPFLVYEGPTEAVQTGMPSRRLVGSSKDLSYYLKSEYHHNVSHSEIVFPSMKPSISPGTGGQFPNVYVEHTCKPTIWPLHQYTENPMRYNVGKLPKKSMNNVYYSLDESFAFKEETSKILLIEKKEIFGKILELDPNKFVPIIAYLHCDDGQGKKFGYQMMEYYKDGSIHDLFKVNVNEVNYTCFLEIYHQKRDQYDKIKKERDLFRSPYMFSAPQEYHHGLEVLNRQVSLLSNELENLIRNFNAIIVQMLEAVDCLHSNGLVHRDIKPHNFLVKRMKSCHCQPLIFCSCEQAGFRVLLGDYDFVSFATSNKWDFAKTKFDYSKKSIKRGTIGYRPIELNFDNEGEEICDPKSDIYSLGVSILEIFAGLNWETCESEIDDILKISLTPLSDKCKESITFQQYQDDLTETYIKIQEKNTELQRQGSIDEFKEISEIVGILASMCTEKDYPNINHSVEQFKYITIEKHDGIQTVLKTVIKAKHVDGHCAMHNWQVVESKWICKIIQHCVNAYPQKRPCIQQLLQS